VNARGTSATKSQRVFVALWPTTDVQMRLSKVADEVVGTTERARRIATSNLHLTLAFIGSLPAERVGELAGEFARCSVSDFDWILDRIGHFDRSLIWAGGARNEALQALATKVRELLDALDVGYDRKPFAPHVTLLRDVRGWKPRPFPIEPPIVWHSNRPALVRSEQRARGVVYVPLAPGQIG
jgi:2'-5' RNA ligase